jgi:hypothetical protein
MAATAGHFGVYLFTGMGRLVHEGTGRLSHSIHTHLYNVILVVQRTKGRQIFTLIGVLTFFIYQSQPLWIPGLAPFLAYYLLKGKKLSSSIAFLTPVLILVIAFHVYKQGIVVFGTIPVYRPDGDLLPRILRIPTFLYYSLHGNYFFDEIQRPNFFCVFVAVAVSALILLLPVVALYNIITRKPGTLLFNISTLSILFTLAYTVFSFNYQPRYLLPITGYALVSLLLLLRTTKINLQILHGSAYVLITAGIISIVTFFDFKFSPIRDKTLRKALGYLTSQGVHYAYCNDNIFTWQVTFYSNEQVICREAQLPGRYPPYFSAVDSAFDNGAKTAYIAAPQKSSDIHDPKMKTVEGYQLLIDPPRDKIRAIFPRLPR